MGKPFEYEPANAAWRTVLGHMAEFRGEGRDQKAARDALAYVDALEERCRRMEEAARLVFVQAGRLDRACDPLRELAAEPKEKE